MKNLFILFFSISIFFSCTSPRDILSTGKVTPKKQIKISGSMAGNLSLMTANELRKTSDLITEENIETYTNSNSSIEYSNTLRQFSRTLISYGLDPIGLNSGFQLKYGLIDKLEIGYRRTGGVNVLSTAYQFIGDIGKIGNETNTKWYGNIGLQYSSQNADKILEKLYLDKLEPFFNYSFTKKDIIIPITFSKSFGPNEKYGAIAFGAVYNFTMVNYGYKPVQLVSSMVTNENFNDFESKFNYSSYGLFCNLKFGYNWVHGILSLNAYYQNIKGIKDLDNRTFDKFYGLTIIPSFALEFNLNRK